MKLFKFMLLLAIFGPYYLIYLAYKSYSERENGTRTLS